MSFSYERYDRQRRRGRGPSSAPPSGGLAYWLPLGLSIATATAGFLVWAWNERRNSGDSGESDDHYDSTTDDREYRRDVQQQQQKTSSAVTYASEQVQSRDVTSESLEIHGSDVQDQSFVSKVSGAMRRTPSPQQFFDGASKRVAAGVAAAGAIVGRGLTAIRESDDDFQDHERWSSEAETRGQPAGDSAAGVALVGSTAASETSRGMTARTAPTSIGARRKMVTVVVSAASTSAGWTESSSGQEVETTSILSHLPADINHSSVDLVILIYAPHLQAYPLGSLNASARSKSRQETSSVSSYSNISTPAADDDRTLDLDPVATDNTSSKYDMLQMTALQLVSHPTQVLPFTTITGHVHLLRHLAPALVYMEESLTGINGENIKEIEGWVGQIVIVIGGEGLVDTETEDEGNDKTKDQGWWKNSSRVGLGKAEIVDSTRFTEDWQRRVTA